MRTVIAVALAIGWATLSFADGPVYLGSFGGGGTGTNAMVNPVGLAVAPDGTVWVAIAGMDMARRYSSTGAYLGGTVTTVHQPTGVAVLSNGQIAVASSDGVTLCGADGTKISDLGFSGAYAVVAEPSGGFWVSEPTAARILSWPAPGTVRVSGQPAGFARTPDGTFYVANRSEDRIDVSGGPGPPFSWGTHGQGPGQFSLPSDVEVANGVVFVADTDNHRVQVFRLDGTYVSQFGTAGTGPGQLLKPSGLAVGTDGTLFVAELSNNRVSRFGDLATATQPASWGRIKLLFR
jgi:tripartite motif-containing protein 71